MEKIKQSFWVSVETQNEYEVMMKWSSEEGIKPWRDNFNSFNDFDGPCFFFVDREQDVWFFDDLRNGHSKLFSNENLISFSDFASIIKLNEKIDTDKEGSFIEDKPKQRKPKQQEYIVYQQTIEKEDIVKHDETHLITNMVMNCIVRKVMAVSEEETLGKFIIGTMDVVVKRKLAPICIKLSELKSIGY